MQTWGGFIDALGADDPIIAGYDPLNEPNSGFAFGAGQSVQLGQFYDATIGAIHAAEAAGSRPSASLVRYEYPGTSSSASTRASRCRCRAATRALDLPGALTGIDSDIDTGALTVTGTAGAPGTADLWMPDRGTRAPVVTGGTDVVAASPKQERSAAVAAERRRLGKVRTQRIDGCGYDDLAVRI
ncbi:MAG: hypothetical protein ACI9AD_000894 [Nitriliruptoraceae bacterium]|jgi:hypothetical protein